MKNAGKSEYIGRIGLRGQQMVKAPIAKDVDKKPTVRKGGDLRSKSSK